jgi:ABC-type multidrug transport system fused ATPase/permease subunit
MEDQDRFVFKQTGSAEENIPVHGDEFQRIMSFYNNQWIVYVGAVFSASAGIFPLVMIWVIAGAFGSILEPEKFHDGMMSMIIEWIYIAIASVIAQGLSALLKGIENPGFVQNLRDALFKRIMEQELDYFDETSTGVLISRLSEDVVFVLDTYIDKVSTCLQYFAQIVGGIGIGLSTSWRVTFVTLGLLPISVVIYYVSEYLINELWLEFRDNSKSSDAQAEEVISGFRTVKSFDNELFEAETYARGLTSVHDVVIRASKVHAVKNSIMYWITLGICSPILYYSCYLCYRKPYLGGGIGDMVSLAVCLTNIAQGVQMTITSLDDFRQAAVSAAKLLLILDKEPSHDRREGETLDTVRGKIEFRDVTFKYKKRGDYAVNCLSFTINPGETVALVGESGCGKTTTLQLLQKFYEPESGSILIDDIDIHTLSSVFVRSQISIVPQGPVLFSMSIADNVRFGVPDASMEQTSSAARIGNAHNFIMELPGNYNTTIAQMSLSGGQKQRICIARAILANSPILLLDEATAALDTESEQLMQQSLEQFRYGKTAVIVAHRLATVQNADRILVFQEGKVVETGTHPELLDQSGIYSDLIKYQLQ